jgi:hypothetical protein
MGIEIRVVFVYVYGYLVVNKERITHFSWFPQVPSALNFFDIRHTVFFTGEAEIEGISGSLLIVSQAEPLCLCVLSEDTQETKQ